MNQDGYISGVFHHTICRSIMRYFSVQLVPVSLLSEKEEESETTGL